MDYYISDYINEVGKDENQEMPFLTRLDERAKIKGSRDPLGLQSIWAGLGRKVIKNLSTVSTSLRDFTTLIVGLYLIEKNIDKTDESSAQIFIKWEQLAAYARFRNGDEGFRGIERVKKNFSSSITISANGEHQVLSNQKAYGIWGLYRVPAMNSDLLKKNSENQLTIPASKFVENYYIPKMEKSGNKIVDRITEILTKPSTEISVDGSESDLMNSLASLLSKVLDKSEKDFYRKCLLYSGEWKDDNLQKQLVDIIESSNRFKKKPSRKFISHLGYRANNDNNTLLSEKLEDILRCESLIAPLSRIFGYLQGMHNESVEKAESFMKEKWDMSGNSIVHSDFDKLTQVPGSIIEESQADRFRSMGRSLNRGQYNKLIRLLVEQNKEIMERRGGGPWIEINDDQFYVNYRDENTSLPEKEKLTELLEHDYFFGSLLKIIREINADHD